MLSTVRYRVASLGVITASALCGSVLPLSGRVALLGILAASWLATLAPTGLLVGVLATAGINLSFLSEDIVQRGGDLPVDPNTLRSVIVLLVFAYLVIREGELLEPFRGILPYLGFIAFSAISISWSSGRAEGLKLFGQFIYPLSAFFLAFFAARRGKSHLVRWSLVGGALASALVNLVVYVAAGSSKAGDSEVRFFGTLGPNPLGLFSAVCALAAYSWTHLRPARFYWVSALVLTGQLIATGSRTSLIAFGVGLLTLNALRRRWMAIGVIALLAVGVWLLVPSLNSRPGVVNNGADVGDESNLTGRLFIWHDIWATLVSGAEVFGRGLGASTSFMADRYATLRSTHNEYLRAISETGLVGVALLLASLFYMYLQMTRARGHGVRGFEADLAISLIALLAVASFTENTLGGYFFFVAPILALYGVSLGMASRQRRQPLTAAN